MGFGLLPYILRRHRKQTLLSKNRFWPTPLRIRNGVHDTYKIPRRTDHRGTCRCDRRRVVRDANGLAWHLGFQSQLGAPWFTVLGFPFYLPWRLFEWWYAYDAYAHDLFNTAGAIAATSGFAGCGAAIVGSLWRARQTKNVTTYGSSRWANRKEIEKAGLFRPAGVFLGQLEWQLSAP